MIFVSSDILLDRTKYESIHGVSVSGRRSLTYYGRKGLQTLKKN